METRAGNRPLAGEERAWSRENPYGAKQGNDAIQYSRVGCPARAHETVQSSGIECRRLCGRDVVGFWSTPTESTRRRGCAKMIEAEGFEVVATMISIGEKERARRERALGDTIANLRIENLHLDDESRRIFQRHVDGEIGLEEFRAAIDELNERRFGPLSVSRNGRS